MKISLVTLLTLFLLGCAHGVNISELPTQRYSPGIYDIQSGKKISKSDLLKKLQQTKYILIGESHDSQLDHDVQLEIVEELGKNSLVGFEMFQRPFQGALNRFVKGELSEEEMLTQTQWETRWGYKLNMYAPIWTSAKNQGAGLIALNIRKELTKRIAAQGIDGISANERADLVDFDLTDLSYRNWLKGIFESHGAKMSEKKMQNYYQAQVLWDETMADTAVNSLTKSDAQRILVIVGRGHVEWDWGIPSRIRRRLNLDYGNDAIKVVIPSDGILPDIDTLKERRFADYIWVH